MRKITKRRTRGLEFKSLMYAIMIMGLFVLSFETLIQTWNVEYNTTVGLDLDEYKNVNETNDIIKGQRGNITVTSTGGSSNFEGTILRGVYGVISNIWGAVGFIDTLITAPVNRFGLPDYVGYILTGMFSIAVLYAIISLFFRGGRTV